MNSMQIGEILSTIDGCTNMFEALLLLSMSVAPLGALMVFRRLSFFGDAVAHSSLFGVAVGFLLFGLSPFAITGGAFASVLLAYGVLWWFEKSKHIASDLALTVTYSGIFSAGILLMGGEGHELQHFLVKRPGDYSPELLWMVRVWAVIVTALYFFKGKQLWLITLDERFARSLGISVRGYQALMAVMVSVSVILLIQIVGLVLVTAYLILPVAVVVPWARGLKNLMVLTVGAAILMTCLGFLVMWNQPRSPEALIPVLGFSLAVLSLWFKKARRHERR